MRHPKTAGLLPDAPAHEYEDDARDKSNCAVIDFILPFDGGRRLKTAGFNMVS